MYFKHHKMMAVVLAAAMAVVPVSENAVCRWHVQAEENFQNIHELYNYWCEAEYSNFPDNVGDVYCYYYPQEEQVDEETVSGNTTSSDMENAADHTVGMVSATSAAVSGFPVGEPNVEMPQEIEVAMDEQEYVLVIGLVKDTKEAEQEILSMLQDKGHVAFTSCNYSHKEIWKVYMEISSLMAGTSGAEGKDMGIREAGITCGCVEPDGNGKFTHMENIVRVTVLEEYYKETAAMLAEMYGDKVRVSAGNVEAVDDVQSIETDDVLTDGILYEDENVSDLDIGGIPKEEDSAEMYGLTRSITALTVGDTFTLKGNWKAGDSFVWSAEPAKKVKIIKSNNSGIKIRAKKKGYVTINAYQDTKKQAVSANKDNSVRKKGTASVSAKVLILDKNGTVSGQKRLMAALESKKVKKITIKTAGKKKFTIPEGTYGEKKIIVDAPNSELVVNNQQILKNLVLKKVKKVDKSMEKEKGNKDEHVSSAENIDIATSITCTENIDTDTPTTCCVLGFSGTVLEIYGDGETALVEPDEGEAIRSSGDRVMVNLTVNTTDQFSVGDRVRVYYYDGVMETFPLQIQTQEVDKIE